MILQIDAMSVYAAITTTYIKHPAEKLLLSSSYHLDIGVTPLKKSRKIWQILYKTDVLGQSKCASQCLRGTANLPLRDPIRTKKSTYIKKLGCSTLFPLITLRRS